jgi:hypothetical protein
VAISPRLLAATRVPPSWAAHFRRRTAGRRYARGDPELRFLAELLRGRPGDHRQDGAHRLGSVQIVGVMPKDFFLFQDFELWMPLQLPVLARPADSNQLVTPFILLDEKQSVEAVTKEMQATVDRINKDYPDLFNAKRHVELFPRCGRTPTSRRRSS